MTYFGKVIGASRKIIECVILVATASAFAQVSPTEVSDARAKADEQKYLSQLVSLQQKIGATSFPFTFRLARYLDARPGQRAALDSNGLEFVYFQQRVVLKVSGFYRVAFDSEQLSENGRASQALQEAVLPILKLITEELPEKTNDYDAVGFEILYDARDSKKSYDYEGREVLAVVFSREDAFALGAAVTGEDRQQILNRSDVFVNGKEFALGLGEEGPLDKKAVKRSVSRPLVERTSFGSGRPLHSSLVAPVSPDVSDEQSESSSTRPADVDATRVQEVLQSQVLAIKNGGAVLAQPSTAPSLETNGDKKLLRFTMRNTLSFEEGQTSIYKRAAQSFDLFLAPELKDISKKVPTDAPIDALAFSVLNRLGAGQHAGETIEFICPMDSMRSFVENKITTQDLINKSTVLVNGVRIGLDLERVE